MFFTIVRQGFSKKEKRDWWNGNYFVQKNVKMDYDGNIQAKIDQEWENYTSQKLPKGFIKWSVENRIKTLDNFLKGKPGPPRLAGPHNGIVASFGKKRDDSNFSLNNAVKGMGFLPKKKKIKEIITLLEETIDADFPKKLKILKQLYSNSETNFSKDKQVSLELYTHPKHETQTFFFQISRPVSTIVFLDIPSFKLKTITRLLHPRNPNLTDYEKDIVKFTNLIHSYFHGKFDKDFVTVVYSVIEVYDNSPKKGARGTRLKPPLP